MKGMASKWMKKIFYGYTLAIILLAVLPINSDGSAINTIYVVDLRLDYLLHFAIYIPWMFLMYLSFSFNFQEMPGKTILVILGSMLFAMINEMVQFFLPFRSFNINDLIANGMGVILGSVFFLRRNKIINE